LGVESRAKTIYNYRGIKPDWRESPFKTDDTVLIRGIHRYTSEDGEIDKLVVVAYNTIYTLDPATGILSTSDYGFMERNSDDLLNFQVINNTLVMMDSKSGMKLNYKGNFSKLGVPAHSELAFSNTMYSLTSIHTMDTDTQFGYTAQFRDTENNSMSGSLPVFADQKCSIIVTHADGIDYVQVDALPTSERNIRTFWLFRTRDLSNNGTDSDLYLVHKTKVTHRYADSMVIRDMWKEDVSGRDYLPTRYLGVDVVPLPCKGMHTGYNRLFLFGNEDATTTLFWCDVDAAGLAKPDQFPPIFQMIIEEGGTTEGTALIEHEDHLYAFKENAIFRITKAAPGLYGNELVFKGVGCVNQRSIVAATNAVFFIDRNGIYLFKRGEPVVANEGLVDFFKEQVNQTEVATKAFMLHDKNDDIILAFVPSLNATYCDRCVTLNLRNNTIAIDMVPEVTCGYVDDTNVYLGTPYGQVLKYSSDSYVDYVEDHFVGEVTL
jgi:hypothetical protein